MTHIKIRTTGKFHTEATHESGARIQTDAPKDNEGEGKLFSPTDLFAASLATCMITVMAIAAKKLGIANFEASGEVEKQMTPSPKRRIGTLIVRIRSPLSLSKEMCEKLERSAVDCPVHRSLHPDIKLEIDFVWGL